jgi:hypothetical protein
MRKSLKIILALTLVSLSCIFKPTPALGQGRKVDLHFKGRTLSADIRKAPLSNVIKEMKEETDIRFHKWLKGSESLFSEEISVRFRSLPVDEGIGRIFSGINYAIVYNGNRIVDVTLFGKARTTRPAVTRRSVSRRSRGLRRTSRR